MKFLFAETFLLRFSFSKAIDHCVRNRRVSLCPRVRVLGSQQGSRQRNRLVHDQDLLLNIPAFVRGCCLSEEASVVKRTQTSFSPFVLPQLAHMTDMIMARFIEGGKR